MVDLVPKAKIESNGIVDALMIGTVKAIEERATMGIIGNGTVTSGAIKLVAGGITQSMLSGKTGKIVGSAFVIDGVEDVVNGLIVPMIYGDKEGSTGQDSNNW